MLDKKQIRQDYKNLIQPKGIFLIKNKMNGKVYMGSSLNLHGILDKNKFVLNSGNHKNTFLQNDWKTLGPDSFEFEIAETLEIKDDINYNYEEDLRILEMLWLDRYQPLSEKLYNKDERIRTV